MNARVYTSEKIVAASQAAKICEEQKTSEAKEVFQQVLDFMQDEFGITEQIQACQKEDTSCCRKVFQRAVEHTGNVSLEEIVPKDVNRAMPVAGLDALHKAMDKLTEGTLIDVPGKGIRFEVVNVDNGIMVPKIKKCNLPNFDVKLKISCIDSNGQGRTIYTEVQFIPEGSKELNAASHKAYRTSRTTTNPVEKLAADAKRLSIHEEIIDKCGLEDFKMERQAREARQTKYTAPALIATAA